jgi:NADH:ubiquinone reductase (H+-translocating)
MAETVPKVVVLGGGYVAITASRKLRAAVRRGEVDVTIVSQENYHVFHGFVGEMLTGRVSPGNILSPVRRIFAPSKVQIVSAERLDRARKTVTVRRQVDGLTYDIAYDHLLLALGSADNADAYPGLREHGFRLKTYDECFRLRNHILRMFELATVSQDAEERRRLLTFFVAGGGYAGTEIAGELADFVRILTSREYGHIDRADCRVVLVCPTPTILPELYSGKGASGYGDGHPGLVRYATEHARRLGVEILTSTRVAAATPSQVHLSNGDVVPTRTIISAVGTKRQPVLDGLDLECDARGRVIVRPDLSVPGGDGLWAAGDCGAVPHPYGGTCPSVGIFALKHGERAADNILRMIRGRPTRPFSYVGLGQGVSIGRRTAVAEVKGVRVRGLLAWLIWRTLLVYYFPTWDRRMRLIADWLIWPIVGRDIVEMGIEDADDYELKHNLFQPGEVIVSEHRSGHLSHLITEGEVEIVAKRSTGDVLVTLLCAGQYFGQDWYDASAPEFARARGVVRTVSIRAHQAAALQRLFGGSGTSAPRSAPEPAPSVDAAAQSRLSLDVGTS